ncbi:MAG: hypothetical protein WBA10_02525 [Elainellaceae cyanobacterium]
MNYDAYPIHCIEHHGQRLYVELIQTVEARQIAWVRPLMLLDITQSHTDATAAAANLVPLEHLDPKVSGEIAATVYNLHDESDLLCPYALLREALDTEVIPLLGYAGSQNDQGDRNRLRDFIRRICSDHPELFTRPDG